MTHTLAKLTVRQDILDSIASKLRDAGYDHVFLDEGIDMTGLLLSGDGITPAISQEVADKTEFAPTETPSVISVTKKELTEKRVELNVTFTIDFPIIYSHEFIEDAPLEVLVDGAEQHVITNYLDDIDNAMAEAVEDNILHDKIKDALTYRQLPFEDANTLPSPAPTRQADGYPRCPETGNLLSN